MEIYAQFVLYFLIIRSINAQKSKKLTLPFPPLTNFTMEDIGKPVFIFEGVNYDELPQNLQKVHTDCYADYIRCTRQLTYHHPVCGYDVRNWRYLYFQSHCELEFQNCLGTNKDRRYHLMGDGWKCDHKRRHNAADIVFKDVLLGYMQNS